MIILYRKAEDTESQEIQEALEEMCLAHQVVAVAGPGARGGSLPEGTRPPVLVDDGKVYQDPRAIRARLEELKAFRELWYKYGSDACYCDEEGNVE